ncbi:hypothetical protein BpHYR1_054572 [Brachionus plicatilis]|uniref:Uncharacterized protein n=1 Tax=Brachionus plicatilis TaxID=10195 RepID=A0A3M7R724_BRAPC|nr:hypothetical protein BpHYR1_054572 [Brachionus plicatilis]
MCLFRQNYCVCVRVQILIPAELAAEGAAPAPLAPTGELELLDKFSLNCSSRYLLRSFSICSMEFNLSE